MVFFLQVPDAQEDLGSVLTNIVKINILLSQASRNLVEDKDTDFSQTDLSVTPCGAHDIVDENATNEDSCLSDSDIDLLMLIGEGLTRQQICSELGMEAAQISRWQEEIMRKANPSKNSSD